MSRKKNVVKFEQRNNFNIGIVIFFVITVYIVFNIFQYMTSETIAAYEVSQGAIASNNTYRGLILRSESVCYSERTGYVNYYVKNASRVSVNDTIYSIDTKGDISDQISAVSASGNMLSNESLKDISLSIDTFTNTYQSSDFFYALTFKNDLESTLLQYVNTAALDQLGSKVNSAAGSTFYLMKPIDTGIVTYYVDGYEGVTVDDVNISMMKTNEYVKQNLKSNTKVTSGDPVYKIITDEAWNIVVPITESLAQTLEGGSSIKIRFCEDDFTVNAKYSIVHNQSEYFLNLSLTTAMIRYVNERFVDIELVLNDEIGLKIPKSSITKKDFYTVPKQAFTQGGDSNSYGLLIQTDTEEGELVNFVTPTIYFETEDYYYIDDEDVSTGDVALMNNSSKKYTIGSDIDSLIGVYNINKGYAVFKQINIIYENEEYAIIEQKTAYGVALYDHIALDGSKLKENQLVTK